MGEKEVTVEMSIEEYNGLIERIIHLESEVCELSRKLNGPPIKDYMDRWL